jgi:hypothetical protein
VELTEQPRCRHTERSTQLLELEAAHQRILQPAGDRDGQGVGSLRIEGGLSHTKARERQHLVPDAADPVLGLLWSLAFDAASSVQDVMPRKPDDVSGVQPGGLGSLDRLAEDGAELRSARAELPCRGEPEVDLEARRQEKCTVDRGWDLEVEVVQGSQLAVEVVAPIGDDHIERHLFGDAEEEVDVGPSVLPAVRSGTGHRSSRDARVLLREPEQLRSQRIPMIAGEHGAQSTWRVLSGWWVGDLPAEKAVTVKEDSEYEHTPGG